MNMTTTNTDGMLNARQVAVLLNFDPYLFHKVYQDTEGVPEPAVILPSDPVLKLEETPLWTTEQVRQMRNAVKPQPRNRNIKWSDSEMLTAQICGELHDPPIKLRSFFANLSRKRSRLREGRTVEGGGVPEPDRRILGHPVWAPETLRDYLATRPGPGYHTTKEQGREGYFGGRVPGTRPRKKAEIAG